MAFENLQRYIARHLRHPSGAFGRFVLFGLNRVNARMIRSAIEWGALMPGERFLDIGFGGGIGFALAARRLRGEGCMIGVEPSPTARASALRRYRRWVESGFLHILDGDAADLPLEDNSADCIITVNTIYFWPDAAAGLAEIRRVLRPGGRFVLAVYTEEQLRAIGLTRFGYTIRSEEELKALLDDAGFTLHGMHSARAYGHDYLGFVAG